MMRDLKFYELTIPFKLTFKHHTAERSRTQTLWVEAEGDGFRGSGEGCPRPYVTGENLESAAVFYRQHGESLRSEVGTLADLCGWMDRHRTDIDRNPAAWCAIELAILELLARIRGVPVENLLAVNAPAGTFGYSAVIGDSHPDSFQALVSRYAKMGFSDFKIKLSGDFERDREKLSILAGFNIQALRLRADANNLWADAAVAISYLPRLDFPVAGIEEPLRPGQFDGMRRLAQEARFPIILDESLIKSSQIPGIAGDPDHWIINVRVSKMGGLLRSLDLVARARAAGIQLTVGSHVGESSLLARVGMTVARAAGDCLFAQEGAFGTYLLESDVVAKPLMFGAGGMLDTAPWGFTENAGWGLEFRHEGGTRVSLQEALSSGPRQR
jgi:L-alanine-DL-glutamate epimerase-like enolase superfamily enzyme